MRAATASRQPEATAGVTRLSGDQSDASAGPRCRWCMDSRVNAHTTPMRITHVESYAVRIAGVSPPFAWRQGLRGSPPDGEGAVLRIGTASGVEGVALAPRRGAGPILKDIVDRVLRDELIGSDALQREWLWHRLWELDRTEELPLYLLGLVDTALWDLAGRVAGQPTWQLLGGFRRSIPAYASTVTFATAEEYLDVITQCLELGYPAIKLHAWGGARADAQLCLAVREHVGPAVPLCVAETSDGVHLNTADFIASGAASFVRTSAELRGGITGAMRIAHLADAFRLRAEVHGMGNYSQHLCMAIPNTTYYESLITSTDVTREAVVDANGLVHAPTGIGLGLPAGPDYPPELHHLVIDAATSAAIL